MSLCFASAKGTHKTILDLLILIQYSVCLYYVYCDIFMDNDVHCQRTGKYICNMLLVKLHGIHLKTLHYM